MPRPARPRLHINWELLGSEAGRLLRTQPGWLAAGLAGPLLIALYTLLREWDLRRAERDLLQAALFLAAWNIVFAVGYALASWLRPRPDSAERELLHLPLSSAHFALRRLLHASAVPLAAALLTLPVWAILAAYAGLPYGQDAAQTEWSWMVGRELANPWWPRMAWVAGCILSAALLPAALAAWLGELAPAPYLRCLLLVGVTAGLYCVSRLAAGWNWPRSGPWYGGWSGDEFGLMILNYRQTRGVDPLPYVVLLVLCLFGPVLIGWLRPGWRWLLLSLPVLCFGVFMLRKTLPEQLRAPLRPLSAAVFGRDARYASALYIGHLAPPKNIRLLFYSYPSTVLFASRGLGPEPEYPQYGDHVSAPARADYRSDPEFAAAHTAYAAAEEQRVRLQEQRWKDYNQAYQAYLAAYGRAPRLALWVGAGLYPLLLPLWAVAGLLLGIELRGEPPRPRA